MLTNMAHTLVTFVEAFSFVLTVNVLCNTIHYCQQDAKVNAQFRTLCPPVINELNRDLYIHLRTRLESRDARG